MGQLLERMKAERDAWRRRSNVRYRFKVTLRDDGQVIKLNWFRSGRVALAFAKRLAAKHTYACNRGRFVQVDNVATGDSRAFSRAMERSP